jgi:hypothetical protein
LIRAVLGLGEEYLPPQIGQESVKKEFNNSSSSSSSSRADWLWGGGRQRPVLLDCWMLAAIIAPIMRCEPLMGGRARPIDRTTTQKFAILFSLAFHHRLEAGLAILIHIYMAMAINVGGWWMR